MTSSLKKKEELNHHVTFNKRSKKIKTMKNLYISVAFLSLGFLGFSQGEGSGKVKKATASFENYSYDSAIEKYEKAQDGSIESQRNLAASYFKVGNTVKAEELYSTLVNEEGATAEDVLAYANVLQENKKYSAADKMMTKFNTMSPADSRGKGYVAAQGSASQLMQDKGQFTVKHLEINSEQEDFSPVYYEGKVLFASSREGVKSIFRRWNRNHLPFLDVYQADKADNNDLSNPEDFQKKLNKKYHEGPVCFNSEETKMILTRNNYKGKSVDGTIKLMMWTIEKDEEGEWGKAVAFPLNSPDYSVGHPSLTEDGKWLYFASDMPGGLGGVDIYKIELKADSTYGEAINLGDKINTEGNEMFPSIHKDGMLFFSSNGRVGLGGLDVFVAELKKDASIGKVMNLQSPINTNKDDFSFILDKNAKGGYLASNREGGRGDDDIYSFGMIKPFVWGKVIKGTATDKNGNILAGALVNLFDSEGEIVETVTTTENGMYEFSVEADLEFSLDGNKEDYFGAKNTASTKTEEEVVTADLVLEKDPGLSLYAIITDKKTKAPLDSVTVTLLDNLTGISEVFTTPVTGDLRKALVGKKLNDRGSWNITIEKADYFTKTVTYGTTLDRPGQYDVHADLDLSLDPEVKDLAELVQINPIKFDFNKYNIRADAQVELNKIVDIMNKYPNMVVELGAHTDCRGSAAYNEKLSDRRAKASAKYIATKITNPKNIYGKGYGENRPIEDCGGSCKSCSDEQHDENRRTEFLIISTGSDVKVNNTSTNSFDNQK
jgi:outer membrane protein OmpA-like peptidoglycan-associated protein/tetratricopeptide (TPR) repeat protein